METPVRTAVHIADRLLWAFVVGALCGAGGVILVGVVFWIAFMLGGGANIV